MGKHKNNDQARGNFVIYILSVFFDVFKIGKADAGRITQSTNTPTRIHQQMRAINDEHGPGAASFDVLDELFDVTTKEAKNVEISRIDQYVSLNNEIPEGNKKSYRPKNTHT